ncbi:MAG TPA: hypothetical protein VHX15_10510 [Frankiaceae bacterium]|nr:hypothetical protein [Frankiaceae bacterium]
MNGWFTRRVLETGRLPLFCFFVAFLVTFLFIRFSVRMIRRQVKWWPGNVTPGGLHIHHAVFGIVFMVIGGLAGLAAPDNPVGIPSACAAIFGLGTALVLDEFALILHLDDVYWSNAGRLSVDAIFVATGVTGLLILGVTPDITGDVTSATKATSHAGAVIGIALSLALNLALAAISLLKGKVWTGLFGLFLPILLLVAAIRIGRPASPWARKFYQNRPKKIEKARRREIRYRRRFVQIKDRMQDVLAGRPTAEVKLEVPDQPVQLEFETAEPPSHPS